MVKSMREANSASTLDLAPARAANQAEDLLSYGKHNPKFKEAEALCLEMCRAGKNLDEISAAIRAKFPDQIHSKVS